MKFRFRNLKARKIPQIVTPHLLDQDESCLPGVGIREGNRHLHTCRFAPRFSRSNFNCHICDGDFKKGRHFLSDEKIDVYGVVLN